MRARSRRLGLTLAVLLLAATPAAAQTTATVTGRLTDEATSAPLPTGGGVGYWVRVGGMNGQSYTASTNSSGQYTIAWIVADSQGAAAGIGSRYFSVANSADAQGQAVAGVQAGCRTAALDEMPAASSPAIAGRSSGEVRRLRLRDDGSHRIALAPLQLLELTLEDVGDGDCRSTWAGYLVEDDALGKLPVGASIDRSGVFYWQPGPGFQGTFDFIFVRTACDGSKQRLRVRVAINENARK
jgi:hypothetical protein